MMLPGAIALITPVIVGFIFGPEVLGGLLAGVTVSGVLMGIFQSNAGGAWDNAKKSFEKGVLINGEMFYKKSEPHKASVTGDTVGDPFKDTSGPSMNILIKLMSIVSLVIAPYIGHLRDKENLFNVAKFKTATFEATEVVKNTEAGEFAYTAKGKLTIKGVAKDVDLQFNYMGTKAIEEYKMNVAGFEGEFDVVCKDFGIDMDGTAEVEFTIEAAQEIK
jgi:polyisoprenoid-binding protein YceI